MSEGSEEAERVKFRYIVKKWAIIVKKLKKSNKKTIILYCRLDKPEAGQTFGAREDTLCI